MGKVRTKKFRSHVNTAKPNTQHKGKATHLDSERLAVVKETFGDDFSDKEDDIESTISVDGKLEANDENGEVLSRGQRKRMKRRDAFMKKMGLVKRVTTARAKEAKQKEEGAFAELEELQKSLFMAEKDMQKSRANLNLNEKKKNALSGKQRQKLAVKELGLLKAVHTHPSFQNNPFAAIQLHLQNTVVHANSEMIKLAELKAKAKGKSTKKTSNRKQNQMEIEA